MVREPLVYSRTPVPAPRIAEDTQVRLMDARPQFPGGKWIEADGCFARDENDGKAKEKQVPSPATNKVSLAISLLFPVVSSL